jgi:hypothetical protein
MTRVEQLRQQRSGTGVLAWDRERAFDGYTLFTPSAGGDRLYINPHVIEPVSLPGSQPRNTIFRTFRYREEEIARVALEHLGT